MLLTFFEDLWVISGETLYLQEDIGEQKDFNEPESERGPPFQLKLRYARKIGPESEIEYLQVQNILLRQVLDNMGLDQLGRAYFNHNEKRDVRKLDIEIWPGFKTAVGNTQGEQVPGDDLALPLTTLCVSITATLRY
jgi:hypothetical protein